MFISGTDSNSSEKKMECGITKQLIWGNIAHWAWAEIPCNSFEIILNDEERSETWWKSRQEKQNVPIWCWRVRNDLTSIYDIQTIRIAFM